MKNKYLDILIKLKIKERVIYFFKKNLILKIFALVLSLAFWAGLVSQDASLTRDKVFENVKVSINGEDTLKRNGFIITNDLNAEPIFTNFIAEVPQNNYDNTRAQNYAPRIDLSGITEVGEIELPITTFSSTSYGTTKNLFPNSVKLNVDYFVTQYRVPIQYEIVGQYPENLFGSEPFLDPKTVQVSGPSEIVKKISKAVVSINPNIYTNSTEGQKRNTLAFKLVDTKGNEINSNFLQVTSESVKINNVVVTQHIYGMQTVKLSTLGLLEGEIKDGYYIKGISVSPAQVKIAGNSELLKSLDNIFINETINIDGKDAGFTQNVTLNIPNEAVYSSAKNAVISVEIEPVIKSKTYTEIPLQVIGKNENYNYEISTKNVDIQIKGPINELNALRSSHIQAIVDVSHLNMGENSVTIEYQLQNSNNDLLEIHTLPNFVNIFVEEK